MSQCRSKPGLNVKEVIQELATNPKTASVVSTLTTSTGIVTILDLIPNDIGKLATVVGIILSTVLIYTHWRKGRIEYEKTKLEITILKEKEVDRLESAALRKEKGQPVRRRDDA